YREIELKKDTLIGKKGLNIRGHEFHYSHVEKNDIKDIETVYHVLRKAGTNKIGEGYLINRTLGSYLHLHFGSNPDAADSFVNACVHYNR
ncbi:MAG: cobyrinate a,c-diamide synthase, partial [bacterium]|nr:cobyrinate a,c-diamide synthase [bacterium]